MLRLVEFVYGPEGFDLTWEQRFETWNTSVARSIKFDNEDRRLKEAEYADLAKFKSQARQARRRLLFPGFTGKLVTNDFSDPHDGYGPEGKELTPDDRIRVVQEHYPIDSSPRGEG
jgi:hypothetical protein